MDYILRILPNMFAGLGVSAQIFLITIVLSLPIGILLALVRISKVAVFRKRSCCRSCSSITGCRSC